MRNNPKFLKRIVALMLVILVSIQINDVYAITIDSENNCCAVKYYSETANESEQEELTESETDKSNYEMKIGIESEEAAVEEAYNEANLRLLNEKYDVENTEYHEESLNQEQQDIIVRNVLNINSGWDFKTNDRTTKGGDFQMGKVKA